MRILICLISIGLLLVESSIDGQTRAAERQAVTIEAAPIFLLPDATRTPLILAKDGSVITVLEIDKDWLHVEFQDPQFGTRTGYIQSKFATVAGTSRRAAVPVDVSVAAARRAPLSLPPGTHADGFVAGEEGHIPESGIYIRIRGQLIEIDPTAFSGGRTGSLLTSAMTYGIKKAKFNAVVRAPRAATRATTANPEFYFYFENAAPVENRPGALASLGASSPTEFVLARMDRGRTERRMTVGEWGLTGVNTGTSAHETIDLSIEKLGRGVFKATPKQSLEPGEYCFFFAATQFMSSGSGKLFDFGID
jgi:hypothetical protein